MPGSTMNKTITLKKIGGIMFKSTNKSHSILQVALYFWLLSSLSTSVFGNPSSNSAKLTDSQTNSDIIVTVLGSGTPVPSATQFGAAILVQAGNKNMMFDCGRGCTTRLAQIDKTLIKQVDHLFVTHLHSDHLVGIDDLWLNGWTQGRKVPLQTWGPKGTNDLMEGIRNTFKQDIEFRVNDNVPAPSAGLDNAFTDFPLEGGVLVNVDGLKVTAFLVDHGSIKPAYGYKIEYKGRTVVISGDTTTTESLYTQGKNADVFLLEVLSPSTIAYLEAYYSKHQVATVLSYHMTADQTAELLKKTKPRLGVYYHTNNDQNASDSLLKATSEIYKGEVVVSHDLFQIFIGDEITTFDASKK
jgi:ribonuclease Z